MASANSNTLIPHFVGLSFIYCLNPSLSYHCLVNADLFVGVVLQLQFGCNQVEILPDLVKRVLSRLAVQDLCATVSEVEIPTDLLEKCTSDMTSLMVGVMRG